ncbi:MAG: hypothetical protein KA711_06835 [Ideonella sp. WA131b]|nr:hypothetical protein [Ideonella sp. WA131b]
MGQQVPRLSGGRVQISNERLDLAGLLSEALRQWGREIDARGIEVRRRTMALTGCAGRQGAGTIPWAGPLP